MSYSGSLEARTGVVARLRTMFVVRPTFQQARRRAPRTGKAEGGETSEAIPRLPAS